MKAELVRRGRAWLGATKAALFGSRPSPIEQIVARDRRFPMYRRAIEFVDYEKVEGDILEFGVFTGMSLAMLAEAYRRRWQTDVERRLAGFDSFSGLKGLSEQHPRWEEGDCAINDSWHPLLAVGARVTPDVTLRLFEASGLPRPEVEAGRFEETLPRLLGSKYRRAAIVHIDCDLYEPTRWVLDSLEPLLQDGTLLLFDDWFHYRANPEAGESRALQAFLETHPGWEAIQYRAYATFCNSFVMHRRT